MTNVQDMRMQLRQEAQDQIQNEKDQSQSQEKIADSI
jgi:hypothetical protein